MDVIGAANNIANGGRQSCFTLDVTCLSNSLSQGAIRNQLMTNGMNVVNMRGKKERPVSPCEAKPMKGIIPRARMSPAIRVQVDLCMCLKSISCQKEKSCPGDNDQNDGEDKVQKPAIALCFFRKRIVVRERAGWRAGISFPAHLGFDGIDSIFSIF